MPANQPKLFIHLYNTQDESVTVEVRSLVQIVQLFQKQVVPMSDNVNQYDTKTVKRVDAQLKGKEDGAYSMYTIAKFSLRMESYNGLTVYTVGIPQAGGYDWQEFNTSFGNEQTATKFLVEQFMEAVREEHNKDEQDETN